MKVIELLTKIANGEYPIVKYRDVKYEYDDTYGDYIVDGEKGAFGLLRGWSLSVILNDEVEIIEEDYKDDKPITKESIEALGYACGEIKKLFESGWNKSTENKPLIEEDKKIEKLHIRDIKYTSCLGFNYDKIMENYEVIREEQVRTQKKINEIIDKINEEK